MSSNVRLLIHFSDIPQAERLKNIRVTVIAARVNLRRRLTGVRLSADKEKAHGLSPIRFLFISRLPRRKRRGYIGVYANVLCRRVRPTWECEGIPHIKQLPSMGNCFIEEKLSNKKIHLIPIITGVLRVFNCMNLDTILSEPCYVLDLLTNTILYDIIIQIKENYGIKRIKNDYQRI